MSVFDKSKIIVANVISAQAWDGAERYAHDFFISNQEAADQFMANLGSQKQHYYSMQPTKIVIAHTVDQITEYKTGEMKRRALAKLTEEDKIVLGLK